MVDPIHTNVTRSMAFSVYANKFLSSGRISGMEHPADSQIFRPPSPDSPSHDPFLPSPSASQSHPHLDGSSRSASPTKTPPFPGLGIEGIPSIDDLGEGGRSSIGFGLLFDGSNLNGPVEYRSADKQITSQGPNPYDQSSDTEGELDLDLEEIDNYRRSVIEPVQRIELQQGSRPKRGWLAYQSVFPSSSSSDESESEKETEEESDDDRTGMMGQSRIKNRPRNETKHSIAGFNQTLQRNMEQPLLDPDEMIQVAPKLPTQLQVYQGRFGHWEREGLRKYKDPFFLVMWLSSLLALAVGLFFVWGSTDAPADAPNKTPPSVVPLIPVLISLLVPTLILPPAFLFLLQKTVRPVLLATAIVVPLSLFVCGWWAFASSFENIGDVDQGDRWWATTGLRLGAVVLWTLAALFARLEWKRRKRLSRTVAVVELSTHLLLTHPPLLLLTPLLLAVFALASIPFMVMLVRLGLIGYWRHPRENTWVFHIRPYAGLLIFLVALGWVWTWGVIRGIGRVAVAGVIGEWYFHRESGLDPLEITTAAVHRATGTSLGSICLGSLIVATVRVVGRGAAELKRLTSPRSKLLPSSLNFLNNLTPLFAIVASVLDQLNGYALIYVGITGEAFWPSARRAVGLTSKKRIGRLLDYTLIKLLLTLSSAAVGLFTATAGYLYMAHSLGNASYAPVAALLCGGVPFFAVRAGAAVLGDVADALFICYQIDAESGGKHCDEAKEVFIGDIISGHSHA